MPENHDYTGEGFDIDAVLEGLLNDYINNRDPAAVLSSLTSLVELYTTNPLTIPSSVNPSTLDLFNKALTHNSFASSAHGLINELSFKIVVEWLTNLFTNGIGACSDETAELLYKELDTFYNTRIFTKSRTNEGGLNYSFNFNPVFLHNFSTYLRAFIFVNFNREIYDPYINEWVEGIVESLEDTQNSPEGISSGYLFHHQEYIGQIISLYQSLNDGIDRISRMHKTSSVSVKRPDILLSDELGESEDSIQLTSRSSAAKEGTLDELLIQLKDADLEEGIILNNINFWATSTEHIPYTLIIIQKTSEFLNENYLKLADALDDPDLEKQIVRDIRYYAHILDVIIDIYSGTPQFEDIANEIKRRLNHLYIPDDIDLGNSKYPTYVPNILIKIQELENRDKKNWANQNPIVKSPRSNN